MTVTGDGGEVLRADTISEMREPLMRDADTETVGYGLGLASNSAVQPMFGKRTVTIMGDGGFWHNGLLSGVASNLMNRISP